MNPKIFTADMVKGLVKQLISANPSTKYLISKRYLRDENTTIGKLKTSDNPDKRFSYTLEDKVRAYGEKVKKHTAIPQNLEGYKVGIFNSPRFGKVVIIYTHIEVRNGSNIYVLKYGGIKFEFIEAHGGNDHTDTDGCILVAQNVDKKAMKIQGSKQKELANLVEKWLKNGFEVRWIVINCE